MPPKKTTKSANENNDNLFAKLLGSAGLFSFAPNSFQKNVAALNSANKLYVEYVQAITKRHQQIAQEAFDDYAEAMREYLSTASPSEKVTQQFDVTRETFEKSIANAGDLGEMYNRFSKELLEGFSNRASEIIDETKDTVKDTQIG